MRPAVDLAELYAQQWEFETALDALKTHQRGAKVVLRSKSPDGVEQEVWGLLLVHWAVRGLMHTAALDTHDPTASRSSARCGWLGVPSPSRPPFP